MQSTFVILRIALRPGFHTLISNSPHSKGATQAQHTGFLMDAQPPPPINVNRFQRLKIFYGIALTFIALTLLSSSILMRHAIQSNQGDARIINLSGRQRMLSQRLTKCVLALDHTGDAGEQAKRLHEISESLIAWKAAHLGLQLGDEKLGLPPRQNSTAITSLFAEIEPFHANMVHALERIMAQVNEGGMNASAVDATAEVMLRNEPRFLELMDKITFQFDKEAKDRIIGIQRIEQGSLYAGLAVLVLEFFLVFRPSISKVGKLMDALCESEAFGIAIRDSLDEHLAVLDEHGMIIAVNRPWQRFAHENGAPEIAANSLGMNYLAVCEKAASMPDNKEAAAVKEGILSVLNGTRQEFSMEYSCDAPNESRWFQVTVHALQGSRKGVVVAHLNISKRKRAEDALRESERRFRAIINASPVPFALNDDRQNITFLNTAFNKVFGYDVADIPTIAQWWPKAYPDANYRTWVAEEWRKRMDKANATGNAFVPMEVNIRCKDGAQRIALVSATPLGGQLHDLYLVVLYDITERKLLEEKFLRSQRVEVIGTLASGIAHDLNNILTPIILSVEMLREAQDPESRECLMESIQECAKRGADVVNQVLTFARGSKGEGLSIQLNHLINEMVKIGVETFPKNISITSSAPAEIWPITGDSTQIHQVLLNLSINARDAMPDGGALHISAENTVVDEAFATMVPDANAGDYVMLAVSDTGIGIERETVLKIFDPFFTTKDVGKGSGLGLSTVAGIVRNHGGFVTVKSEVGQGTTFKVFLPRDAHGKMEKEPLHTTEFAQESSGATILVVDDELAIAKTLSMVLENNGYKVLMAFDGNEALAIYRERAAEIGLVLTDVMMPGMDGVALSRALREINPRVNIIASTGQASESRQGELHALGIDLILHKPYVAKDMLTLLHAMIHAEDTCPDRS